jgi:murein DD-endopeptidase MepM/ murein hydrolase activator NlpD
MLGTRQRRFKPGILPVLLCTGMLLGACSSPQTPPAPAVVIAPPVSTPSLPPVVENTPRNPTLTAKPDFTITAAPILPPSAAPSSTPAVPTLAPALAVCSPLQDIKLSELAQPDILKNPFQISRPGMDDGHFGADFAYWSRGTHKQMLGLPVLSVLNGRVAGVIKNRMPYGNAVIIETPLNAIPTSWQPVLPTPAPTVPPAPNLICPPDPASYPAYSGRSLYLLYAHLNQAPMVSLEQPVSCGQIIGEVGTTGRSVNPHLHLETRSGPAGVTFAEMAHYDNAATESEMATYCTWRISGLFQAFDPLKILALQP